MARARMSGPARRSRRPGRRCLTAVDPDPARSFSCAGPCRSGAPIYMRVQASGLCGITCPILYVLNAIVGISTESWEDAARGAIATAGKNLRDLRVAQVVKMARPSRTERSPDREPKRRCLRKLGVAVVPAR